MKEPKIYYTLSKHNGSWHVWKNCETERGYGFRTIYENEKKKECIKYCKENNIQLRGGLQ